MVTACLISTTLTWDGNAFEVSAEEEEEEYDTIDGPSEEDAYLQGEFCYPARIVPFYRSSVL